MSAYHSISDKDHDIIMQPMQQQKITFIFLHGFGETASQYSALFLDQSYNLRFVKLIFLTSPEVDFPFLGLTKTHRWFETNLNWDFLNLNSYKDACKSSERVQKVIETEVESYNGEASKVFIGGFSQGAAMSLMIGLESKYEIGGVVMLSGFGFPEIQIKNPNLKITVFHGTEDDIVPLNQVEMNLGKFRILSNFEFNIVENLGHFVSKDIVCQISIFLSNYSFGQNLKNLKSI